MVGLDWVGGWAGWLSRTSPTTPRSARPGPAFKFPMPSSRGGWAGLGGWLGWVVEQNQPNHPAKCAGPGSAFTNFPVAGCARNSPPPKLQLAAPKTATRDVAQVAVSPAKLQLAPPKLQLRCGASCSFPRNSNFPPKTATRDVVQVTFSARAGPEKRVASCSFGGRPPRISRSRLGGPVKIGALPGRGRIGAESDRPFREREN